jgi:thiamine-phosphate pyrophosphorylase
VTPPTPQLRALPPLLVLTDRRAAAARGRSLHQTVAAAVAGGARAVVLREKDLSRPQRARLAERLRELLAPVAGLLIVASDASLGGDGVHLAEADAPVRGPLVGRSCHDTAGLSRAAAEGCAYATVSPVCPTSSKPGYGPALGFDGLRASVAQATVAVYALGGVRASGAAACRRAGAAGVAVMGAVMGAADPAAEVAALLAAWTDAAAVRR